jgi:diaminopimelate decarboxylase
MNSKKTEHTASHIRAIQGVPIEHLVARFGSPLFVFSERTLRESYTRMVSAFQAHATNVTIAWSYKTNYLQAICKLFQRMGAKSEIVSRMEYEMASALGVPGTDIIYNGPAKSFAMLQQALLSNAFIQIDHLHELTNIIAIAEKSQKQFSVGLRLHIPLENGADWSRFGFAIDSVEAWEAIHTLASCPYLQLTGLHGHLGTMIASPTAYAHAVQKMADFKNKIESKTKFRINQFNLGGGFPSQSLPHATQHAAALPGIEEYAAAICQAMRVAFSQHLQPKLILEPGRSLVDAAGYLITTICGRKKTPTGTNAYILDAGVNLLPQAMLCSYPLAITKHITAPLETTHLYGPLCMNTDILSTNSMLPAMQSGEHVIFQSVGAYNVTQSLQFIEYRPNIVWITENGQVELIRASETLADIRRLEQIPSHLG